VEQIEQVFEGETRFAHSGPKMVRKIVVALSGGKDRDSVLAFAAAMAAETGATVRVVHILERELYGGRIFPVETVGEATSLVNDAVSQLRYQGIGASGAVRYAIVGRAGTNIAAEAADWGADVIVLGSERRHHLRHLFGRGVRDKVVRHSRLPVIVAPPFAGSELARPESQQAKRRSAA
jgi:nucleotide-binding universal stress UspA family protein